MGSAREPRRSFAADAHEPHHGQDQTILPHTSLWHEDLSPMANSPRILNTPADKHRSGTEAMQKPASQFIVAPRAQASRRCETQAPLGGKPQAMLPFRSLDPFRPLREPDRRRRDEERLSRSEQRTANKPKDHLTGKAPYRFESCSLQQRVGRTSQPRGSRPLKRAHLVSAPRKPPAGVSCPF